jgi:methylase of polypeptide subunit release factors
LLQRAPQAYDIILANLPYVPARYQINEAARHEPDVAIFGGGDGLALYRQLFNQLSFSYVKPRYVLTESLPFQHAGLQIIAESAGFRFHRHQDFIQVFSSE